MVSYSNLTSQQRSNSKCRPKFTRFVAFNKILLNHASSLLLLALCLSSSPPNPIQCFLLFHWSINTKRYLQWGSRLLYLFLPVKAPALATMKSLWYPRHITQEDILDINLFYAWSSVISLPVYIPLTWWPLIFLHTFLNLCQPLIHFFFVVSSQHVFFFVYCLKTEK